MTPRNGPPMARTGPIPTPGLDSASSTRQLRSRCCCWADGGIPSARGSRSLAAECCRRRNTQLHIGPASHLDWWVGAQTLLLNFFETHLKGDQADATAPAMRLWNITSERWQQPEPSSALHWQLIGDGATCLDPAQGRLDESAEGSGELTIVHDPWRPAPAIGGHLSPSAGPVDRRSIDARSDVATFSSAPCLQSMTLQGQPHDLDVHADQPGFDLCVALSGCRRKRSGGTTQHGRAATTGAGRHDRLNRCVVMQPLLATLSRRPIAVVDRWGAWPAIGVNSGSPDVDCDALPPTTASSR